MKTLLVVVDMQNDFVTGALANSDAAGMIPSVVAVVREHIAAGGEIAFTRDTHGPDYLSTQEGRLLPVPHCVSGTRGHEIIDELKPFLSGAHVFDKRAFGSTELGEFVRDGRYDKLIFVGVCTDICVISNAFVVKAFAPETAVYVRADACAGVSKNSHNTALSALRAAQVFVE